MSTNTLPIPFRCAPAIIAVAALMAAGWASPAASQALADRMLKRINDVRREHSVAPVKEDAKLKQAALEHSKDMAEHDVFGHEGSDGAQLETRLKRVGFDYKVFAENVAGGLGSPEATVDAWMESPEHRKNLLNVQVCRIGVGYVHAPNDNGKITYKHYWTVVLARPPGPFCPLN
jgi:uncharacterized protein YkwD